MIPTQKLGFHHSLPSGNVSIPQEGEVAKIGQLLWRVKRFHRKD